jgi:hypothetical protein
MNMNYRHFLYSLLPQVKILLGWRFLDRIFNRDQLNQPRQSILSCSPIIRF